LRERQTRATTDTEDGGNQSFHYENSSENAWVRIASSMRTSAANRLENMRPHRHVRTLEAMRTQAWFYCFSASHALAG
jgi:hypothetical protein